MAAAASALPRVSVTRYSARTEFDRFTDMERMASPSEVQSLLTSISNRGLLRDYLLFPEHREFAVRDTAAIPLRWILASQQADVTRPAFAATVQPDEFFTFQIGLLATGCVRDNSCLPLRQPSDCLLSDHFLRCYFTCGIHAALFRSAVSTRPVRVVGYEMVAPADLRLVQAVNCFSLEGISYEGAGKLAVVFSSMCERLVCQPADRSII